jgi:hypothetical protein
MKGPHLEMPIDSGIGLSIRIDNLREVIGRMAPKMAPKKATKQSSITSMGFPLLQKPAEICVGRQIQVLGSYWTGRMSNEETNSLYK